MKRMDSTGKGSNVVDSNVLEMRRIERSIQECDGGPQDKERLVSAADALVRLVTNLRGEHNTHKLDKRLVVLIAECMNLAVDWFVYCQRLRDARIREELEAYAERLEALFPISSRAYNPTLAKICERVGVSPFVRILLEPQDIEHLEEQLGDCTDPEVGRGLICDVTFRRVAEKIDDAAWEQHTRDVWLPWLGIYMRAIAILGVYPNKGCKKFRNARFPPWIRKKLEDFVRENGFLPTDVTF